MESNNAAICQHIFVQQLQSNFSRGAKEAQGVYLILNQGHQGLEGKEQEVLVTTILGIHNLPNIG